MGYQEDNKDAGYKDYFSDSFKDIVDHGVGAGGYTPDHIGTKVDEYFGPDATDNYDSTGQVISSSDEIYALLDSDDGYLDHVAAGNSSDSYFETIYDENGNIVTPAPFDELADAHWESLETQAYSRDEAFQQFSPEDQAAFSQAAAAASEDLGEQLANAMVGLAEKTGAKDAEGKPIYDLDPDIDVSTPAQQHDRLRWAEQCFLSAASKPLADLHAQYIRPYSYVDVVDGPPNEFLNRFYNHLNASHFVEIEPGDSSELMPYFRLSKILYEVEEEEKSGKISYKYHDEIPLVFEQMAHEDTIETHPSGYNGQTVAENSQYEQWSGIAGSIIEGEPPATGYGWESFEWEYIGSNPATVKNDIKATLKLTFQDFNQLAKVRIAQGTQTGKPISYSLLDLLGYGKEQDRKKQNFAVRTKNNREDEYRPEFFEIKAVAGWHNHDFRDPSLNGRTARFREALKNQRTVLWLTMVDHNFDISEIGVFTLTIHYRARLAGLLTNPKADILMTPEHRSEIGKIMDDINKALKKCDNKKVQDLRQELDQKLTDSRISDLSSILDRFIASPAGDNSASLVEDNASVQKHNFKSQKTERSLTGKPYSFPETRDSNGYTLGDGGRIFHVNIPSETLIGFATGVPDATSVTNLIAELAGGKALDPESGLNSDKDDRVAKSAADTIRAETAANPDIGNLEALREIVPYHLAGAGIVRVSFFYLGDLIEIAASMAFAENTFGQETDLNLPPETRNRIKIILGSMEFYDQDSGAQRINLADLPISVTSFVDFWYKNVIATKRRTYPLLDFIKDVTSQLVVRAAGAECFVYNGHPLGSSPVRLRTGFVTLPGQDTTKNGFVEDPLLSISKDEAYDPVNGGIKLEFINKTEPDLNSAATQADRGQLPIQKPVGTFLRDIGSLERGDLNRCNHYMLVFAENVIPWDLNGDEAKDSERGIHHLKIHKGILHSAVFSKTDAPYLREARFQRYSYNPLVHLSNVYDVNLEMLGNTIFYPGTYLYLNPIGFGTSLGDPIAPGSISNHIAQRFTTSIRARWDSNGSGAPRDSLGPAHTEACGDQAEIQDIT